MYIWLQSDIRVYCGYILGYSAEPDRKGEIKLPCPTARSHHFALLRMSDGHWNCPCAEGEIHDYEWRRRGYRFSETAAIQAVKEIIEVAQAEAIERGQQARNLCIQLSLSKRNYRLLRSVFRSPGVSRSRLQRSSHLAAQSFDRMMRELTRAGLISPRSIPSTGGRSRVLLFPPVPPENCES